MTHPTISRLRHRHRWLEERLRAEMRRSVADSFLIQSLKRQKLQVKDALFQAEAELSPNRAGMNRA